MNTPDERLLPLPFVALEASPRRYQEEEHRLSDEDLMERLRVKDSAALDALFRRHARLVMGIAFRTLRDHAEAEDTVQETFLFLYQKATLFDAHKGTAKAWIVQVAFHRALDRRSYLVRRGFYFGTDLDVVRDTLAETSDLNQEMEARLSCAKLEPAFAELSHLQRQTLELFFFQGMEIREIADKLSETLGNVRHHYYRGLERLRATAFVRKLRSAQGSGTLGR
jgi:RNA polymerase sigma-70 factor (ECF subfamily)